MNEINRFSAPKNALPKIHLGGTNAPQLLDGYNAAYEALIAAREAFDKIDFNSRDYLPHPDGVFGWAAAWEWRTQITDKYLSIEDYLLNHIESIHEQNH